MASSSSLIVIAGYGTGISHAVATLFGKKGFKLALVSRTQAKLDAAAQEFSSQGVTAKGFAADLSKPEQVKPLIHQIKKELGSISILFWNPYGAPKSLLTATADALVESFNIATTSFILAVQEAQEDLVANKGSVLVTGGGLSLDNHNVAQLAANWNAGVLAVAKASQRKSVDVLHWNLKPLDVFR
eukprot:TRINITY_DN5300_c0_g1_i1.p1 TRINITY_DN5300_c0_g1~~TRINITY_DN5300_c0_g1_i1.p1  ORF type:complete len:186 (-),score=55.77 TRINITY_DN5300_c0_g1_i1:242-799(-)